jgi:uncharacterized protein (DUF4415 family)
MRVADEVQDPHKTGLHTGDFVRVRLDEIVVSEFSREMVGWQTLLNRLAMATAIPGGGKRTM